MLLFMYLQGKLFSYEDLKCGIVHCKIGGANTTQWCQTVWSYTSNHSMLL